LSGSIELTTDGESLLIRFPYREDLVDEVRGLPERRWDRETRVWRVPATHVDQVVGVLLPHGFATTPEVDKIRSGGGKRPPGLFDNDTDGAATTAAVALDRPALTISAVNERVRRAVRASFPEAVWVIGEVLDFDKTGNKRHAFFSLVEKRKSDNQPAARARVALFGATAERLREKMKTAAGELALRDGLEVRVLVRVDLYAASGSYQLIIEDIDPSFTLGKMALTREAILAELRAAQLHRTNAGKPLPVPPLRVGVLTSPDSDAWNDFVQQLSAAGAPFAVTCYAVRVQGNDLRRTMLAGLSWFATHSADFDLLCVLRGGGSRSDLAWFDDRDVAFAAARHPLKIICGIGHQRDQSILDHICHSEKTPTAVGALLVESVREAASQLRLAGERLRSLTSARLEERRARLGSAGGRLLQTLSGRVASERKRLQFVGDRLRRSCSVVCSDARRRRAEGLSGLVTVVRHALERATAAIDRQCARQRLLDPRRVIERGYVLVRDSDGRVLQSVTEIEPGVEVETVFRDGRAKMTAIDITVEESAP